MSIFLGLQPIIVEPILSGDELRTDVLGMETQITTLGSNNIVCILSTTSCFAPRASDSLEHIATLCSRHNIPHLVNNAYGLQSARLMHLIQEAAKLVYFITMPTFFSSIFYIFAADYPLGGNLLLSQVSLKCAYIVYIFSVNY